MLYVCTYIAVEVDVLGDPKNTSSTAIAVPLLPLEKAKRCMFAHTTSVGVDVLDNP